MFCEEISIFLITLDKMKLVKIVVEGNHSGRVGDIDILPALGESLLTVGHSYRLNAAVSRWLVHWFLQGKAALGGQG
jgi:hypothetical protein